MKNLVLSLTLLISALSITSCDEREAQGEVPKVDYQQHEGAIDGDTVSVETAATTNEVNFLEESYYDGQENELRVKYGEDKDGKYATYDKDGQTYRLPQTKEDESGAYYEKDNIKLHSTKNNLDLNIGDESFKYEKH